MAMIPAERRATAGLAGIYALRMLGLFIVLPVLALAARDLAGATPLLIGVAVGIYGLTQALLQIPFGLLSDHCGRRRVILFGLLLFVLGSVVCALADNIGWLITGRALQGAGAIAAALMALAADLTRDEVRTRTMALIGISIGAAFSLSLLLGPLLHGWLGLDGLFWLATGLALMAMVVLVAVVPEPHGRQPQRDASPVYAQLRAVVRHRELLRLDAGICLLHCIMTATFVALPLTLESAGLPGPSHWQIYLPVLICSVAGMVPLILVEERGSRVRPPFLGAIVLIAAGQIGLVLGGADLVAIGAVLLLFFIGFNFLEATLPARISRVAPAAHKGTAMGVYASAQFLGAFVGGSLAGGVHQLVGTEAVFAVLAVIALLWLLFSLGMPEPRRGRSVLVRLDAESLAQPDRLAQGLAAVAGVEEVVVVAEEGVAYLKVDPDAFDAAGVQALGGEMAY